MGCLPAANLRPICQNYAAAQKFYQLENFINWKIFVAMAVRGGMIAVVGLILEWDESGETPVMGTRTRVKICCIASPAESEMAAAAGADLLGIVGQMPTGPGPIEDRMARHITAGAVPWAAQVLLTACETADDITEHAARIGVRAVQIVNHVAPAIHARLARSAPGLARIQVIHVEDAGALDLIADYVPHVTAFLLDSGRPALRELGGTGRVHDWAISAEFVRRSDWPVFLAGGLTPENVAEAIRMVRPFGVDVCTGVRVAGRLDRDRLRAFMAAVHGADRETGS
jgi:phosphoribosylanthranilate isomerase